MLKKIAKRTMSLIRKGLRETLRFLLRTRVARWIAIYLVGVGLLGFFFLLLRASGIVRVYNRHRLPKGGGFVIISNHPSWLEVILLPFLFYWRALLRPGKYFPVSTPDHRLASNVLFPLQDHIIPINRQDPHSEENRRAMRNMIKLISNDGILILFPEGGRTFKPTDARGQQREPLLNKGTHWEIRPLKEGVTVVLRSGALLVPVWVKRKGRFSTSINIGEYFTAVVDSSESKSNRRSKVLEKVLKRLYDVADELYALEN